MLKITGEVVLGLVAVTMLLFIWRWPFKPHTQPEDLMALADATRESRPHAGERLVTDAELAELEASWRAKYEDQR